MKEKILKLLKTYKEKISYLKILEPGLFIFSFLLAFLLVWATSNLQEKVVVNPKTTVLGAPEEIFCFAHISDSHTDSASYVQTKLGWDVDYFNKTIKPPFVIDTGDTVTYSTQGNFQIYKNIMSQLTVPYYVTPGNHDLQNGVSNFTQAIGPASFTFDYQTYHFVGFNALSIDFTWIESQLKAAPLGKSILFSHYPILTLNDPVLRNYLMGETGRAKIKNLIAQYKVLAYLSGHAHFPFTVYEAQTNSLNIAAGTIGSIQIVCLDENKVSNSSVSAYQTPLIIITSPEQYFSGGERGKVFVPIAVRAKVFSTNPIASVSYKVDSGSFGPLTAVGNNVWEATWNSGEVALGQHTLTAKVTDSGGRSFEHKINIYVGVSTGPTAVPTGSFVTNVPTPMGASPTSGPLPTLTACQKSGGMCCSGSLSSNCIERLAAYSFWSGGQITTSGGCNPAKTTDGASCCKSCRYPTPTPTKGSLLPTNTPATATPTLAPSPTTVPTTPPAQPTPTSSFSQTYCQQISGVCCKGPTNSHCQNQKIYSNNPTYYGTQGGCSPSGLLPFTFFCCAKCT